MRSFVQFLESPMPVPAPAQEIKVGQIIATPDKFRQLDDLVRSLGYHVSQWFAVPFGLGEMMQQILKQPTESKTVRCIAIETFGDEKHPILAFHEGNRGTLIKLSEIQ